ncbi:hypothetical protein [Rhizobium giardinii]|uniref:hypothetical protein n=1 Tax=Rhizobium giardinii TaxID=56731 RepID=UPI000367BE7C|nr:hypothetical protein [Rhizobium giardinii]
MPNIKIYTDKGLPKHTQLCVRESLAPLREIICRVLKVENSACQFAIVPAYVMAGQAVVNVEIAILPKPERTHPMLAALAEEVQLLMARMSLKAELPCGYRSSTRRRTFL